jgi:hypothetical protein
MNISVPNIKGDLAVRIDVSIEDDEGNWIGKSIMRDNGDGTIDIPKWWYEKYLYNNGKGNTPINESVDEVDDITLEKTDELYMDDDDKPNNEEI